MKELRKKKLFVLVDVLCVLVGKLKQTSEKKYFILLTIQQLSTMTSWLVYLKTYLDSCDIYWHLTGANNYCC